MRSLVIGFRAALLILAAFFLLGANISCGTPRQEKAVTTSEVLSKHCEEAIGEPRVEQISEHVWVALGYDQANTALIHTEDGNVIVDVSMSPVAARAVKQALIEKAPSGPIKAIIYTHSHIDHVGGASVWAEKNTQIWATDAFIEHFFKQYGLFIKAETTRGVRQFGFNVPQEELPCCAIGARTYYQASFESGVLMPTHTFSDSETLEIGGLQIEMREGYGETHDQLFVWIPEDKTLIPADNFYWAFPNLYTIRGTSPRPVDEWIKSLDEMRRLEPEHLVPMHTKPIHGKQEIAEALTNYRDAIQWVRDEVVRRANRGEDIDTIAESIKLPTHLAEKPYLRELYGQVDWSARGIYTNSLGWFDGRPDKLYPLPHNEVAKREVMLMGGPEKVLELANQALQSNDTRWAIHLLAKLQDSGLASDELAKLLSEKLVESYRALAQTMSNTNGRAYLLESALELSQDMPEPQSPKISEKMASSIPLETIFSHMAARLNPEKSSNIHESVHFVFPDENKRFVVTVRNGIAEIVEGEPLPGTPEPVAIITADSLAYRMVAMDMSSPVSAYASGKITIEGSWPGFLKFMSRFQTAGANN